MLGNINFFHKRIDNGEVLKPIEKTMSLSIALLRLWDTGGRLIFSGSGHIVVRSHFFRAEDTESFRGDEVDISVLRNAIEHIQSGIHKSKILAILVSLGATTADAEASVRLTKKKREGFPVYLPSGESYATYFEVELLTAALLAKETGEPLLDIVSTI